MLPNPLIAPRRTGMEKAEEASWDKASSTFGDPQETRASTADSRTTPLESDPAAIFNDETTAASHLCFKASAASARDTVLPSWRSSLMSSCTDSGELSLAQQQCKTGRQG